MESLRPYAREKLAEILGVQPTSPMAINAETSAFNYVTRRARSKGIYRLASRTKEASVFKEMYKNKILSLLFNLKNPKNPKLLQHILSKDIECRLLGFLTREQLFPELWEPIKEKLAKHDPSVLIDDDIGTGGPVKCSRCRGKGRVHVSIVQTRSADEGSTLFCYCANCTGRWKIYT